MSIAFAFFILIFLYGPIHYARTFELRQELKVARIEKAAAEQEVVKYQTFIREFEKALNRRIME